MKLSEAIRIGSKIRPQAYYQLYATTEVGQCSCAAGAALEAVKPKFAESVFKLTNVDEYLGMAEADKASDEVCKLFPQLLNPTKHFTSLYTNIQYRNDVLKHSREEIAEWLESIGY